MIKSAAKHFHIINGFKKLGLIDEKHGRYPDFNLIIATCRRNPSVEKYMLYYNPIVEIFGIFHQSGLITENQFKRLAFVADRGAMGRPIYHTAGISQEHCQQCKYLTHPDQTFLHDDCLLKIAATITAEKL